MEQKTNFYNSYNYPYTKISRFLRKFIKCFYFNRHLPIHKIILGIINRKKFLSLGSFDQVKAEYIVQSKDFYYHIAWIDLIGQNNKGTTKDKEIISKVEYLSNNLLKPMLNIIKNHEKISPYSNNLDLNNIFQVWKNRIKDLCLIYGKLKSLNKISKLLITECGNPFHKILAASFKDKGTEVINFTHGNDFCYVDQRRTLNYLISTCNQYVFETKKLAATFKKKRKNLVLDSKEQVKYIGINTSALKAAKSLFPTIIKKKK